MNNQLEIYALRDQKVGVFLNPMFMQSSGQVLRMLSDMVNRKTDVGGDVPMLVTHPEDFELFLIGMYDASSGEITVDKPRSVVLCKDLVEKSNGLVR